MRLAFVAWARKSCSALIFSAGTGTKTGLTLLPHNNNIERTKQYVETSGVQKPSSV
jgi:hypothetical protein